MFRLHADYETAGDQQQAIDQLVEQLEAGHLRSCYRTTRPWLASFGRR